MNAITSPALRWYCKFCSSVFDGVVMTNYVILILSSALGYKLITCSENTAYTAMVMTDVMTVW